MSNAKSCPVTSGCGFCWKNPLQVALFLAVLPWAVKTIGWLWSGVVAVSTAAGK